MSLIKCSECNHDVSDKAESCPNCGFPIRKNVSLDDSLSAHSQIYVTMEEEIQGLMESFVPPTEPYKEETSAILSSKATAIICVSLIVIWLIFTVHGWTSTGDEYQVLGGLIIMLVAPVIVFGARAIADSENRKDVYDYSVKKYHYDKYMEDPEGYKRKWAEKQYERNHMPEPTNSSPLQRRCPKCGGTSFTPVRKKYSFATGFATNDIELVCNNCGNRMKAQR